MTPGALIIEIADRSTTIQVVGGGNWVLPVGPLSLVEDQLERSDRPSPEQLTNALGIVTDHLDDVVRESPMVEATLGVTIAGPHAIALARVEIGADDVPHDYSLARVDADDVFRTIVSEPRSERLHNPGLAERDVDTVIGTCCVVLATMRRLELTSVFVADVASGAGG